MRLAASVDDAWRTLLAHPTLRGTLAGHAGTAVLEEADDDEHVARFRLQGVRDGEPATATVTAALSPAGDATEVDVRAEVHGAIAPDELLAALAEAAAAAVAAPVAPSVVAAAAEPATVAAADEPEPAVPVAPPAVAAPDEVAPAAPPAVAAPAEPPAPGGLSGPAKRALAVAGAAALVGLALRGRR